LDDRQSREGLTEHALFDRLRYLQHRSYRAFRRGAVREAARRWALGNETPTGGEFGLALAKSKLSRGNVGFDTLPP